MTDSAMSFAVFERSGRENPETVAAYHALAPPLRARALAALRPPRFSSLDRFTPVLYMFNPMRFGAETRQHFSSATDQEGLVLAILAAQALTE